jgi:uncharacterized membrane protein
MILIFGFVVSAINFVLTLANNLIGKNFSLILGSKRHRQGKATMMGVRLQLGEVTALGLEILVISDILETLDFPIHEYSFSLLGKIGAVALFRTILAIVLGMEISEIKHEMNEREFGRSSHSFDPYNIDVGRLKAGRASHRGMF